MNILVQNKYFICRTFDIYDSCFKTSQCVAWAKPKEKTSHTVQVFTSSEFEALIPEIAKATFKTFFPQLFQKDKLHKHVITTCTHPCVIFSAKHNTLYRIIMQTHSDSHLICAGQVASWQIQYSNVRASKRSSDHWGRDQLFWQCSVTVTGCPPVCLSLHGNYSCIHTEVHFIQLNHKTSNIHTLLCFVKGLREPQAILTAGKVF